MRQFTVGSVPQLLVVTLLVLISTSSHGKTLCETRYRNIHPEHSMCQARNDKCKFRHGAEENADEILDLHNQIRKSIQLFVGKEYFEGKNMKNMQWDHELYLIARKHASQCTGLPDCYQCHQTDRFHVEQNFATKTFSSVNESINGTIERFKIVIKEWAEELRKYNPEIVKKFHFIGLPTNWTNIFRFTTNRVGCASLAYDTQKEGSFKEVYICNYGPAFLTEGEAIYEPANGDCSECFNLSNCDNSLCKNQLLNKYGNNMSHLANEAPRMGKRSGVSWMATKEESSPNLSSCPEEYRNITPDHSYCKPDIAGCTFRRGYVRYRRKLLAVHNEIRNSVEAYAGWDNGTATNMRVMEWDGDLYEFARRYVIQCLETPDCHLCHQAVGFPVEQNFDVRIISSEGLGSQERFAKVINEWAMQLKNFERSDVEHLPRGILERDDKKWINVFRARAWKVGCASVSFETPSAPGIVKEVYICNYGPAELSEGEEVYEIGKSCSNCDPGLECDQIYTNLCSTPTKKNRGTTAISAASTMETIGPESDIIADEIIGTTNPAVTTSTTAATTTKMTTATPTTITTTTSPTTTTTTAPTTTTIITTVPTTTTTTTTPRTMTTVTTASTTTAMTTTASVAPSTVISTVVPVTTPVPPAASSVTQQSSVEFTPTTTATSEPQLTTPQKQTEYGSSIASIPIAEMTLQTQTPAQEILDNTSSLHPSTTAAPTTSFMSEKPHRNFTDGTTNVHELPVETGTVFPVTNKDQFPSKLSKGDIVWNCTLRFFNDETCRYEQQCYEAWTMSSDGKHPYLEIDMPENKKTALLFLQHIYIERPSCFTFAYKKDVLTGFSSLTSSLYGIAVRTESNEHIVVDMSDDVPVWSYLPLDIPWRNAFVQVGVAVKTQYGIGEQHIQIKDLLIRVGPCSVL